jgi:hypothetical protein
VTLFLSLGVLPAVSAARPGPRLTDTGSEAASRPGVTFLGYNGQSIDQDRQWAARSQIPMPDATVEITTDSNLCAGGVGGCRTGTGTPAEPFIVYARDRDDFYFEMGGIFDDAMLSNGDRGYLARNWGVPHWHWSDTQAGVAAGAADGVGVEDGLEGMFATIYQDCGWGHNTRNASYGGILPAGLKVNVPSISTGSFDTCAYIEGLTDRAPVGSRSAVTWPGQDSNLRATDYESAALTN